MVVLKVSLSVDERVTELVVMSVVSKVVYLAEKLVGEMVVLLAV